MGEIPRQSEETPEEKSELKSYAQQMIEKMNKDTKKKQAQLGEHVAEIQRIREKIKKGEVVTQEERDLLGRPATKTIREAKEKY